MAKLPKFLHFQTKIKYTEDHNIEVQLEDVTDHDWVEVVRCRDCIMWNGNDCTTMYGLSRPRPNDYCARGISSEVLG